MTKISDLTMPRTGSASRSKTGGTKKLELRAACNEACRRLMRARGYAMTDDENFGMSSGRRGVH